MTLKSLVIVYISTIYETNNVRLLTKIHALFISNTCKQYQAEINKKVEQKLNNALRLNFYY